MPPLDASYTTNTTNITNSPKKRSKLWKKMFRRKNKQNYNENTNITNEPNKYYSKQSIDSNFDSGISTGFDTDGTFGDNGDIGDGTDYSYGSTDSNQQHHISVTKAKSLNTPNMVSKEGKNFKYKGVGLSSMSQSITSSQSAKNLSRKDKFDKFDRSGPKNQTVMNDEELTPVCVLLFCCFFVL